MRRSLVFGISAAAERGEGAEEGGPGGSVGVGENERCGETFLVDRVVRFEVDHQPAVGGYELRRNLESGQGVIHLVCTLFYAKSDPPLPPVKMF